MIEHTITELQHSGIKAICVVIRKGKEVVEEYLKRQKYKGIEINFVYQRKPLGIGDALRSAKDFVGGYLLSWPFQTKYFYRKNRQRDNYWSRARKQKGIWNSMVRIPKKELCFFEGARSFRYQKGIGNVYLLKGFSQDKDSLIRGFGRTIFLSEALDYMTKEYLNEETGEVDFSTPMK